MSPEKIDFSKELSFQETPIPGLLIADLPVHGDERGWFKENWQREKMRALGLPDFGPVQNNISFNAQRGVTRGIHAEPWDKYVSVGAGRIFGAWVDLREGDSYGAVFSAEIDPSKAIFVPRGVGNAFQALEDNTVYTYLVNDHWSAENKEYAFLNLADETAGINWPISLDKAELSDKDKNHPSLLEVTAIKPRKILVTGANGQLGKALQVEFPDAEFVDRTTFDITDPETWGRRNWRQYQAIINAAAYTKVDQAETPEGRIEAWKANAYAVQELARLAIENRLTLVHISSDYVFDGSREIHDETEPYSPLGVYGQSKAAGDIAAATVPNHYILRTSWVIGEGNNFVNTMRSLAEKGVDPTVVSDQIGRLTFTTDIAQAVHHLLDSKAEAGIYNVSNDGKPASWAKIAARVFELSGHDKNRVSGVTTAEYYAGKTGIAPRPLQSTLNIDKIVSAGFAPREWDTALREYLEHQQP
ncbi:MAG: dTDP-4-dehydro-6-deoxy-D-glucose 3,5-epimerase/dTDP-4-dehydrorhamnose reductase [Candidatus Saccharibacteria bacterium]|nr:dTDP-4-dehydro-6-deoxy-D-glucose 3,5-epimerase/dTDP-4-dehydrorhamnose reductase [Candidatus Saccharibacteria bacterium]